MPSRRHSSPDLNEDGHDHPPAVPHGRDRRPTPSTAPKAVPRWRLHHEGINALGWSLFGFIVGAVFWHVIGFWDFMGNVVLSGHGDKRRNAAETPTWQAEVKTPPTPFRPATGGKRVATPAPAPSCTLLTLDRATGDTTSQTCPPGQIALPAGTMLEKADLLTAAATNNVVINTDGSAVATWSTRAKTTQRP